MDSLDRFAANQLQELESRHLRREVLETERLEPAYVMRNGRKLISFCCNDYLNLTHHPKVKAAVERYGAGSGSSRLVTGSHPLFAELEARLARLKGTQSAMVFGSGYLANTGIIPCLVGAGDLLLVDELSHACIHTGARLSAARIDVFAHNDMAALEALLCEQRSGHKHCLIVTDGVFSMDGNLAPIDELTDLAARHESWLMTDDAHGVGVLGGGRGSCFANGRASPVPLQMGTLSKALGSYGGYLCASAPVIDLVRNRARSFVYTTGLPPSAAAAAIAALELIEDDPQWAATPLAKARRFAQLLNLPAPESCIVPMIVGDAETALKASTLLEEQGFLVAAIRPPTVPEDTSRLRFTFSAGHEDADIEKLAEAVRHLGLVA